MTLVVRIPSWELEENGRVLTVGDAFSSWLTFNDGGDTSALSGGAQVLQASAHPLPTWLGGGMHPVLLDVLGAALYWDAPGQVEEGQVTVVGAISTNTMDAPDGFPETTGVVRRIRMEWQDSVMGQDGSWHPAPGGPRYEEVSASSLPRIEIEEPDPAVDADLQRRARQAYEREVTSGRITRGDPFTVVMGVAHVRSRPPGATDTRWTGVLIELETTGTRSG